VQTTDLSIQPQYVWPHGVQTLNGYEVTNTVTAKLRDFATAGSVVDAIAKNAGNAVRVDSLTFSVEDTRSLEDQARTQAVQEAVSHAKAMASAAGEKLGSICSIADDTQPFSYSQYDQRAALSASSPTAGTAGGSSVPLEPGSQQVDDQVTVTYALAR
jgi:uncharacterized protein YggE